MNAEYVEQIRQIVFSNLNSYYTVLRRPENKHLYDYIIENTPLLADKKYKFRTKVAWILNGLTEFPKCKVCGRELHTNLVVTSSLSKTCSSNCANKDPNKIQKIKDTKLERFGSSTYNNHDKASQTKLKRYGDENYNNSKKNLETFKKHKEKNPEFLSEISMRRKQTNLMRYGNECVVCNPVIREKIRNTVLEKYGVEHPMKCLEIKEKAKQRFLEKYGVDNPWKADVCKEKIRKTKLEKYGSETYTNSKLAVETFERHKQEIPNFLEKIEEKAKATNLERYGVDHFSKLSKFRKHISDIMSSKDMQARIYRVKKANNSFNASKQEEIAYELLAEKFPSTVRQYHSEKYPFNCDFYIPEKDLYIEFNGNWTHGKHAFDPNNEEDLKTVEKWKAKNTKFYNVAIDVWTRRDTIKRETAKANNLNFIEFWNVGEVKAWLSTISS